MRNRAILASLAIALSAPAAWAQTSAAPSTGFVLPHTESWDMTAAHGEVYRLYVSRPEGEPPEGGFPVLYVLDGNALFPLFSESRRLQGVYEHGLDDFIVVGIGYPSGEMYDVRRLADFTPPNLSPAPPAQQRLAQYESGRRDLFRAFLMERVRPEIARRYQINPHRQSLFGHSLGGLFALHMLYTHPRDFHAIIATSATIWWNEQAIVAEEARFAARLARDPSPARGARLLLLVGGSEEAQVTVGDNTALAARLALLSAHGLRGEFHVLDDETHMTVPGASVSATIRTAMQWP